MSNGNGGVREAGWITTLRIIVPVLVSFTLFMAVAGLRQIAELQAAQSDIKSRLTAVESGLGEKGRIDEGYERRINRLENPRNHLGDD